MIIKFKTQADIQSADLINLYQAVGWYAYTASPDSLQQAIHHSLDVISAWDNNRLVGLVRTVGDNQTILYVQDILVAPPYQGKGIGRQLMAQVLIRHQNVRQKVLLTDDTVATRNFYKKCGFTDTNRLNLVSFYREF